LEQYLSLIISGVVDGSVIAIAAMGLVVTYKASGIFNFAHGAMAACAAGIFFQLYELWDLPLALSLLVTFLIAGIGFGLIMERVAYLVSSASTTMKVVATVGVMITLTALFTLRFGGTTQSFPAYLPQENFRLGGVNISYDKLIIFLVGVACAIGMTFFFRRTLTGRAMRAIVDDPELVSLIGVKPTAVRRWSWIIGTTFAAMAGVLIAPSLGLDPTSLTVLVITSFGAAAVGSFANLPLTYAGAILIQVGVSLSTKWASTDDSLHALPATLPFVVLFVVLLVTPKRRLIEAGEMLQQRLSALPNPSLPVGALRVLPVAVVLVFIPEFVGAHLSAWTLGMVFVILMMSLSLLVRTSNQISLCQMSFAAVGAVAYYQMQELGAPWWISVLVAGLAAVPIGAFLAIAAVRFSGVYLALATLAFGAALEIAVYPTGLMFGESGLPLLTPRPDFAQSNSEYFYLVLVVLALCYLFIRVLERSRLGLLLRSKADAPMAVNALGVSTSVLQTVVFCAGAFLAGVAGSLIGPIFRVIGAGNFQTIPTSILLVALLVLGSRNPRIGTLGASLIGAIGLVVLPDYISDGTTLSYLNLLFGVAAVEAAYASSRPARRLKRSGQGPDGTPPGSVERVEVEAVAGAGAVTNARGQDGAVPA
jgi:branched-subunit amino acid ABC-type transport system permease component